MDPISDTCSRPPIDHIAILVSAARAVNSLFVAFASAATACSLSEVLRRQRFPPRGLSQSRFVGRARLARELDLARYLPGGTHSCVVRWDRLLRTD